MPKYTMTLTINIDKAQRTSLKCPQCHTRLHQIYQPAHALAYAHICPQCLREHEPQTDDLVVNYTTDGLPTLQAPPDQEIQP